MCVCLQPFLIAENMWPRGCVLDCQRGRHRAVCGSNGRLYKSQCAFQRAQCINTQLRVAPRAHCSGKHDTTQFPMMLWRFVHRPPFVFLCRCRHILFRSVEAHVDTLLCRCYADKVPAGPGTGPGGQGPQQPCQPCSRCLCARVQC